MTGRDKNLLNMGWNNVGAIAVVTVWMIHNQLMICCRRHHHHHNQHITNNRWLADLVAITELIGDNGGMTFVLSLFEMITHS